MWLKRGKAEYLLLEGIAGIRIEPVPELVEQEIGSPIQSGAKVILVRLELRTGDNVAVGMVTRSAPGVNDIEEQTDKMIASFETCLREGGHFWDTTEYHEALQRHNRMGKRV